MSWKVAQSSAGGDSFKIGHGYDLHRLEAKPPHGNGRPFILAGLEIDHPSGPVGHSDGDAVFHAVTDAVFGALGLPDIGEQFPDTDPALDGADSRIFMAAARAAIDAAGCCLGNMDITIICEQPKISPLKRQMTANIAAQLACEPARINIKGKTHEKVDAVGEGRAIEVHVVVLLRRRGEDATP